MLARFSTVAGEQGSPDTWRDVRGFSLKFYTDEGNYDLVGNNTPIFFVRDPMKFPHFIRSQKRLPDSGLRDNHMQWDFWTNNPGVRAPGHLSDGRARPAAHLAAHERLRLAHLHVDQCRGREILGQVPLPHRTRAWRSSPTPKPPPWRAPMPTSIAATCSRPSRAASIRAGRCRSRSCPMPRPGPTGSIRST